MSKILSDHKRHGKKFITPYNQLGTITEFNWTNNALPELLWIDLMLENINIHEAVELCRYLISTANEIYTNRTDKKICFAASSAFSKLTNNEVKQLKEKLIKLNLYMKFSYPLTPLTHLYDDFPMKPLFEPNEINTENAISKIKNATKHGIDKTSKRSTYMIATAIYGASASGMLYFNEDSPISEINEIENYPDTDESQKIAAFLRSSINAIIEPFSEDVSSNWPRYFWSENYRIDKCDVNYPYEF